MAAQMASQANIAAAAVIITLACAQRHGCLNNTVHCGEHEMGKEK